MPDEQVSVLDQILKRLLSDLEQRPEFDEAVVLRLQALVAADGMDRPRDVLAALADGGARTA